MFIFAAALFSLSINAQRPERKANPVNTETKKSEATDQRKRIESTIRTNNSESQRNTTVNRSASESNRNENRSENVARPSVTRSIPENPRTESRNESSVRSDNNRSAYENPRTQERNENVERTSNQRTTTTSREFTTRTEEPVRNTGESSGSEYNRNRNENSVRSDNNPEPERQVIRTRNESESRNTGRTEEFTVRTNTGPVTETEVTRRERSVSGAGENNTERRYAEQRRNYNTPNRTVVHHEQAHYYNPEPFEYRKVHYAYREPYRIHVIWTPRMYHEYMIMYPDYSFWYYPIGYNILTISAYDALYHVGEVRNVYGRVQNVWYAWQTDEYYLYFGGPYPFQDFTVIIPGRKARHFGNRPELFFEGRHIWITGLISIFEGKPEIMVHRSSQIHLY